MRRPDNKLITAVIALIAVIIMVALTARFFGSSETLSDYAAKHPEQQTGTTATSDISYEASPGVSPVTEAESD